MLLHSFYSWALDPSKISANRMVCAQVTATFSKRRKVGALWNERCVEEHRFFSRVQHRVGRKWRSGLFSFCFTHFFPVLGAPHSAAVQCRGDAGMDWQQADKSLPPRKIAVTIGLSVESISVVTLIRTDTTLDHSQKAEKVYLKWKTAMTEMCTWQKTGNLLINTGVLSHDLFS